MQKVFSKHTFIKTNVVQVYVTYFLQEVYMFWCVSKHSNLAHGSIWDLMTDCSDIILALDRNVKHQLDLSTRTNPVFNRHI